MLKIYIGENMAQAEKEIEKIKAQADPYNYVSLSGDKLSPADLQSHAQIMPFFGGTKTICLRGLLGRFERGSKENVRSKSKNAAPSLAEQFAEILNSLPDFSDVIMLEPKCSDSNSLLKMLTKAEVVRCEVPKGAALAQYIEQMVREKDAQIERTAAYTLSTLAGSDMLALENEIDKLLLYTNGRPINNDDLAEMCSLVKEQSIFAMVDAVVKKDGKTAEKTLTQMLKSGAAPTMITHMLTRSYRIMLLMSAAKAQGLKGIAAKNAVDKALGTPVKPFEFTKLEEQSRAYTLPRLKTIYKELLDCDVSIKTGRAEPEAAASLLIESLIYS